MERFHIMIAEARALIKSQMVNKNNRPDYMSDKQLYAILDELEKMDRIRNHNLFFPYYPKGIADSWEYTDPLAKQLLELSEIYRKL